MRVSKRYIGSSFSPPLHVSLSCTRLVFASARAHPSAGSPRRGLTPEQALCVFGNHCVLIGLDDTQRDSAAVRRDDWRMGRVALRIKADAQEFQTRTDTLSNHGGMLADAPA